MNEELLPKAAVANPPPAPPAFSPSGSYTRLSGRTLLVARLFWLTVVLPSLVDFAGKSVLVYQLLQHPSATVQPLLEQSGISPTLRATVILGVEGLTSFVFFAVAFALVRLKSDLLPALLAATAFVTFGASGTTLNVLAQTDERWLLPATLVGYIYRISFIVFCYTFPDGRFIPHWTKALSALWAFTILFAALPENVPISMSHWPQLGAILELLTFATIVYSQLHSYRHVSSPDQRRQTRWVAFGLIVALTCSFAVELPNMLLPALSGPTVAALEYQLFFISIWDLSLMLIPITVSIAGLFAVAIAPSLPLGQVVSSIMAHREFA